MQALNWLRSWSYDDFIFTDHELWYIISEKLATRGGVIQMHIPTKSSNSLLLMNPPTKILWMYASQHNKLNWTALILNVSFLSIRERFFTLWTCFLMDQDSIQHSTKMLIGRPCSCGDQTIIHSHVPEAYTISLHLRA